MRIWTVRKKFSGYSPSLCHYMLHLFVFLTAAAEETVNSAPPSDSHPPQRHLTQHKVKTTQEINGTITFILTLPHALCHFLKEIDPFMGLGLGLSLPASYPALIQ